MNRKWTRAICTVLTSALVFTGPAVEGTTFSGYINSGLEKVYAKTQKQKDAEKKKSQAEQDLKDKKNEINGLKDQQQITADDIKNKSAKLDEILAAQKKLQTDITNKQAEIEQNQKDLAAAQEKQQEQYDAMKKRIQFMYENSAEDNIWTAIIESNGITDMLNRIEYVSDVYDSDRALMDSYQAAVEQVKEIGTKLDNDMNELTAMQDDYEKQQADVEAAIVALENQKEQYASQIAQAQQQADNYQNIITAQGKIIQEQEAAAAAAAAAAARANSSSSSPSYDGGGAGKGGSIASDYAAGIKKDEIHRGSIIAPINSMTDTMMADVKIKLIKGMDRVIDNRTRLRLYNILDFGAKCLHQHAKMLPMTGLTCRCLAGIMPTCSPS